MRRIFLLLIMGALSLGAWYYWKNHPQLLSTITPEEFQTFKMRYTSESLMERHKKELLKNGSTYLEPQLTYFPYLMMEVKYSKGASETCEGILLWGLSDGEMVLDVDTWAMTHGFEDCLMAKVDGCDFKVLRYLAANGGLIEKAVLEKEFIGDDVSEWVASLVKKKLVVEKGAKVRLHLQNPRLEIEPHTKLTEWVVTLPDSPTKAVKRYGTGEVLKFTQLAFGEDFAIRRSREVYLPVFEIAVKNDDGSVLTTYWNALTGKRIDEHL